VDVHRDGRGTHVPGTGVAHGGEVLALDEVHLVRGDLAQGRFGLFTPAFVVVLVPEGFVPGTFQLVLDVQGRHVVPRGAGGPVARGVLGDGGEVGHGLWECFGRDEFRQREFVRVGGTTRGQDTGGHHQRGQGR